MKIIQVHKNGAILFRQRDDEYPTYEYLSHFDAKYPSDKKVIAFAKKHGLRRNQQWQIQDWGKEAFLRKY